MTWWQERKLLIILIPYTNLRHYIWAQNICCAFITLICKGENEAWGLRHWAEWRSPSKAIAGSAPCLCTLHSLSSSGRQMHSLSRSSEPLGWTRTKTPTENVQGTEALSTSFAKCTCGQCRSLLRECFMPPRECAVSILASVRRAHCNKNFTEFGQVFCIVAVLFCFLMEKKSFSKCYQFQSN